MWITYMNGFVFLKIFPKFCGCTEMYEDTGIKMASDVVELGFAEKREPEWLTNRYFPSKIGGKPAWLDLDNMPSANELACKICSQPMSFICQVTHPPDQQILI